MLIEEKLPVTSSDEAVEVFLVKGVPGGAEVSERVFADEFLLTCLFHDLDVRVQIVLDGHNEFDKRVVVSFPVAADLSLEVFKGDLLPPHVELCVLLVIDSLVVLWELVPVQMQPERLGHQVNVIGLLTFLKLDQVRSVLSHQLVHYLLAVLYPQQFLLEWRIGLGNLELGHLDPKVRLLGLSPCVFDVRTLLCKKIKHFWVSMEII